MTREVTPSGPVKSCFDAMPLSMIAMPTPVPLKPDFQAALALTAAVVKSRKLLCARFGETYLTFGSASSAARRLEDTVTLTALIELKIFFIWPYGPRCCSSFLVGGVLNYTITFT